MVEQNANFVEPSYHGACSLEKVIGSSKQSTDLDYFSDLNEVPYIPGINLAMEKLIEEKIYEALSGIFVTGQKELDNVQTTELNQINEDEILQKSPAELSQIEKVTIVNSSNNRNHQKINVTTQNDRSFKVPVPTPRKNSEMLNKHREQNNDLDLKRGNNNSKQPKKFEVEESTDSDYCSDSNNAPFYSITPSGTLQRETQNNVLNRGTHEITYVNGIELASTLNDPFYENFQAKKAVMLAAHPEKKPLPTPRNSFPNGKITKEQQNNCGVFPRKCNLEEPYYDEVLESEEENDVDKERNNSSCSSQIYEIPYQEMISPRDSLRIEKAVKALTNKLSSFRKVAPRLQDTYELMEMLMQKQREINGIGKCENKGNINETMCCNNSQEKPLPAPRKSQQTLNLEQKLAECERLLLESIAENESLKKKIVTQELEMKPWFSYLPNESEVSAISCEIH